MAVEPSPARDFLRELGSSMRPLPRAILLVSAHWTTRGHRVGSTPQPRTIHDFGNFGPELAAMRYEPPGSPDVARAALVQLHDGGFEVSEDRERGLDHGAWVPLSLLRPQADIPIATLSIDPTRDAAYHLRLGRALHPLRHDGVMILTSGSLTHDLRSVTWNDPAAPTDAQASEFAAWIHDRVEHDDREALADWEARAPHAARNHPTPEHFLPFFVAAGAGDAGKRIHSSGTYGALAMDAYSFA
ncbi:dioxygenase [Rhodospirillales bacterium TMPK1]|uniref:Dioxygenase n=2 Tax=Roseiterribacter gracilis TaxID=2812848 RepID=A0A8S8XD49_9PROT|nr:dioxygenase [Rhodospirillales bacterium TMPK1]